jgi:transcriptional regulator of arginine metabolism
MGAQSTDITILRGETSRAERETMSKTSRQHVIIRLLAEEPVVSQAQLVELLADHDIDATQTTVSRDLDELGAIKVRVPGGDLVYALPEHPNEQVAQPDHLRRVLGDWVAEVTHSHNLVIIRTPPGSAHVVASALDRSGMDGVLGTVAGDDSILVVATEETTGAELAEAIRTLAGA